MNFSAPIRNVDGKIVGVWSNCGSFERTVGESTSANMAAAKDKGIDLKMQVLRKDGLVLGDVDPETVFRMNLAEQGLAAARLGVEGKTCFVLEKNLNSNVMQVNGYTSQCGYRVFPGFGWVVLARCPSSPAVNAATSIRNSVIAIDVFAALVLIGTQNVNWQNAGVGRAKLQAISKSQAVVEFQMAADASALRLLEELSQKARPVSGKKGPTNQDASGQFKWIRLPLRHHDPIRQVAP